MEEEHLRILSHMATAANDREMMERSGHYLLENQTVDSRKGDLGTGSSNLSVLDLYVKRKMNIYLDLPKRANWFLRVSMYHPLGFNWHPLEGAGRHIYIYIYIDKICFFPIGSIYHLPIPGVNVGNLKLICHTYWSPWVFGKLFPNNLWPSHHWRIQRTQIHPSPSNSQDVDRTTPRLLYQALLAPERPASVPWTHWQLHDISHTWNIIQKSIKCIGMQKQYLTPMCVYTYIYIYIYLYVWKNNQSHESYRFANLENTRYKFDG